MHEFLSGTSLAQKIHEICAGEDLRIAVAYWGDRIPEALGLNEKTGFRVICDISSGGTNPAALKSLGAPENEMLLHSKKLHAKVYISSAGCVVGSANASENGIGTPPETNEAGIFCRVGEDTEIAASNWFETLWGEAKQVDTAAMEQCKKAWQRSASGRAVKAQERETSVRTLPDLLKENPAAFGDIQFYLTNEEIDRKTRAEIKNVNEEEGEGHDPQRYYIFEIDSDKINKTPARFISIHRGPKQGFYVSLLTPGFKSKACPESMQVNNSIYCAVPHKLTGGIFCELNDILELKKYRNWPFGGGYNLEKGVFRDDDFDEAVGDFYSADELSKLLFPDVSS